MSTHDPKQIIEQLQTILCSPSKKIGFLFGAGISIKDKDNASLIPAIEEMTKIVLNKFTNSPDKDAIQEMKEEIELEAVETFKKRKIVDAVKEKKVKEKAFNIESLLSMISAKHRAVGSAKLCGLDKEGLRKLRKEVENEIKEIVSVHSKKDFTSRKLNHDSLIRWIKNANRQTPIEIFTTNYDYLFETNLEKLQIPYFDGFVGSNNAFFYPEWIEDDYAVCNWTKLWKLHGSLGWTRLENGEIVRSSKGNEAMIYPSFLKYDHSKKQPYLSYMDRLSHFLRQEDAVLFVCGYSFGDEHINEMILTALSRGRSSTVFILNFEELSEDDYISEEIAMKSSKISVYAKKTAVIGCTFGEWKLEREPDANESKFILSHAFEEEAVKTGGKWTGKGNFQLGDFEKFTNFLSLFYANSKHHKERDGK